MGGFMNKARAYICIFFVVLLLSGCGKESESTNLAKGMELVEKYEFQSALESFETALLGDEDKQLSYRGQGIAYMGLGNYADAEAAFLKSLEYAKNKFSVDKLEFDTNYYLAAAYMKQGKYADAEQVYSSILELRKKEKDAYYLRACAILRQNRFDDAVKDFEKALSLDPNNLQLVTDAFVEMQAAGFDEQGKAYVQKYMEGKDKKLKDTQKGIIYYYLGDYEQARLLLDSSINGNDPDISMVLGQAYEKLGELEYAATVYRTYLDSHDPNAALYNSLGVCFMSQQKYNEAKEAFEKGVAIGNSDYLQELRFNLIVANEYLGEFSQAKNLMQEYLQYYPDDDAAKKENEFLQTR